MLKVALSIMFLATMLGTIPQSRVAAPAPPIPLKENELRNVVITLKQENHCGCIHCCAIFEVTLTGDGTVTYQGIDPVPIEGKQIYSIPVDQVEALVAEFYKADFFSLPSEFTFRNNADGTTTSVDHTAPITTSITIRGKTKEVYDFFGAPEKLKNLEKKIIEASQLKVVSPH